jgi:hypothetical protein
MLRTDDLSLVYIMKNFDLWFELYISLVTGYMWKTFCLRIWYTLVMYWKDGIKNFYGNCVYPFYICIFKCFIAEFLTTCKKLDGA